MLYRPNHENSYYSKNISVLFSICSFLIGGFLWISAIYIFFSHQGNREIGVASIFYLYGSPAIYYGVRDLLTSIQALKTKLSDIKYYSENEN